MGLRVFVQIVVLVAILEAIRLVGHIVPPLQWVNAIFIVYYWLIFHPLYPVDWAWRVGWLIAAQVAAPILPFGTLLVAGTLFVLFIRFVQVRYIEHTHWAAFLSLITIGLVVWELILWGSLLLATMVSGAPAILMPSTAFFLLFVREIVATIACVGALLVIDSFADHGSIRNTLRRYYEHLHERALPATR